MANNGNLTPWVAGQSGNLNGRPIGSRTVFSQGFLKDALKPSVHTLADHAALELGGAGDLKHQPAGGRGGVDRLLIEIQIHPASLQRENAIDLSVLPI